MGKTLLLLLAILLSIKSYSQDTLKSKELTSIQVIGIKTDDREPVTQTKYNCDSLSFLNQQKDPFFILDKISPSIYSQSDNGQGNGYSYLRMRGLDQTRINFNLNGIPLNEMEDQGIYFSNMPGFYNYLSNITIQRGVGNSKFGQTSVAGSVNMESKDMTKRIREANLLVNSNLPNNHYYNIFYSPGMNKNGFTYQIGGTWQKNQGFKDHSGNSGGSLFYGLGLYKKYNIFKIYGFTGFSHNQLAFLGVPKSDSIPYNTNLNSINDKDTFNQSLVSFNWVNFSNENLKVNTSLYFANVNGTYNTGGILFGVNSYQYGAMTNIVYEKKRDFINLAFNVNSYKREHFGQDYNGVYFDTITISDYKNIGYKNDISTFIKYIRTFNKISLFSDIQLRYINFKTKHDSLNYYITDNNINWIFFNPKIGSRYNITKHSSMYTSIAYTQREPTRTDMIQGNIQSNNISFGNPDNTKWFKNNNTNTNPENVLDIEFGYNYKSSTLRFNSNLYMMKIKNEFIATGVIDAFSGFMIKRSVNSTYRYGFESDGDLSINRFKLFYTFQYQISKINDSLLHNKEIPFNPNIITSIGSTYTYGKFLCGLTSQYVSSMRMDLDSAKSEGYITLNGFIDFKYDKSLTLSFRINNLLDHKYYIPAGVGYNDVNWVYHNEKVYYTGQLRNWAINLKYTF